MNHFISTLWEEGIIRTSIFGFIANLISTDFVRRLDRGVQKIPPAISVAYKVVATTIFPDFEMFADTRFRRCINAMLSFNLTTSTNRYLRKSSMMRLIQNTWNSINSVVSGMNNLKTYLIDNLEMKVGRYDILHTSCSALARELILYTYVQPTITDALTDFSSNFRTYQALYNQNVSVTEEEVKNIIHIMESEKTIGNGVIYSEVIEWHKELLRNGSRNAEGRILIQVLSGSDVWN